MPHVRRLEFLSEGLPQIHASARSLWKASRKLAKKRPREAGVLEGLAEEEAAKVLILMDAVRCPESCIDSRIGPIMGWFYDHLARLIYVESVGWRPLDVKELREFVDSHRKAYELVGYAGEDIVPNWHIYMRESLIYVDVEAGEDGKLSWSNPVQKPTTYSSTVPPLVLQLTESMDLAGIFSLEGLKATSEIWGTVEFVDSQSYAEATALTEKLVKRLIREGLPSKSVTQRHAEMLFNLWTWPMYNLDFDLLEVTKEELDEIRNLELARLGGYAQDGLEPLASDYW